MEKGGAVREGRRNRKALWAAVAFALLLVLSACILLLSRPEEMPVPAGPGVSRCLLMGWDRFVTMPDTAPVNANNVREIAGIMEKQVPEVRELITVTEGPGTVAAFEDQVRAAFREAGPNDVSYLYLATHGITWKADTGAQKTGLLLSDGEKEELLEPERLREILDRVPGEKVLIVEACYSGGLIGKGMEGHPANPFAGSRIRVLVSGGGGEKSYLWTAADAPDQGQGYFTAALVTALEDSRSTLTDADGSGEISLNEVYEALCSLHGASRVYVYPEEDQRCLFRPVSDRSRIFGGKRLLTGLRFAEGALNPENPAQEIYFTLREDTRLIYAMIPSRDGEWQFDEAVRLPDRERTGTTRGLLSAGVKHRTVRLHAPEEGESGYSLLELMTLRPGGAVLEASRMLCIPAATGDPGLRVETGESFAPDRGEEMDITVRYSRNCTLTVSVETPDGQVVRILWDNRLSRPGGAVYLYWNGTGPDGEKLPAGDYRIRVSAATGDRSREAFSPVFRLVRKGNRNTK